VSDAGSYSVQYDPRALKELTKLDKQVAWRIARAVDGARPLVGYPGLWRIRVGDYRVVYAIKDAELLILALRVAHRSAVYRNL